MHNYSMQGAQTARLPPYPTACRFHPLLVSCAGGITSAIHPLHITHRSECLFAALLLLAFPGLPYSPFDGPSVHDLVRSS